jgi:peptidoglycan/xylan/chitin deacetylase (PgdA/CDA1 family)
MKNYRITRRGKLFILIFSVLFLMVNISFIPVVKIDILNIVNTVENKVYAKSNFEYENNSNNSKNIEIANKTNKKNAYEEYTPEIKAPLQTTLQAIALENSTELSYPVEQAYKEDGKKIAFLTFDDGPSSTNTPKILDTLEHYNIKATFFIIGYEAEKNKEVLVKIKNDGQAIGNHTYSHKYSKIYSSVSSFIVDIKKADTVFKQILGEDFKTRICRFPGGSFGESNKPYIEALNREGYVDINWNTIIGDADGINIEKDKLIAKLKATAKHQSHLVVLMHDSPSKSTTVEALPEIIEYLKGEGYEFATLK